MGRGRETMHRRPLPTRTSSICWLAGAAVLPMIYPTAARPAQPVPNRTELTHPCSRLISRSVRKRLEKEVLRPARNELSIHDEWPSGCPFDPSKDLYLKQEKQKQHKRAGGHGHGSSWICGLCGKTFKSEHYLDLHMERRHMDAAPSSGVCLADYCDMFEVCKTDSKGNPKKYLMQTCDNESMDVARERCTTAMTKCFPLKQEKSRRLYAANTRHWCQVLDCRVREHRRREEDNAHMPAIVLVILICLVCFIVFVCMIYCVDYSEDIMTSLKECGIVSDDCLKRFRRTQHEGRKLMKMERTRQI